MTPASLCDADTAALPPAVARAGQDTRGELLGDRYRLEELVGQGGMGRVYRATDELLGRTVAIKLFPAAANDRADRARRESETRLLASLSHPSLVTLYDAETLEDGSGYLVMEYVGGGTLADCIARGPMAPHHVAHIAADLGEALHAVHSGGVIHRDIKPPNVLLRSGEGRPFQAALADFGIAYLIDTARMTTPGMAVGTAAYFSPEQARGAQPTPASDIYALGLVLIEALTGRRAFPQTTPIEAAVARLHSPPDVPAGFGYGWRSLLTAMTAAEPADRPSAVEVAERARALTAGAVAAEAAPVTTLTEAPATAAALVEPPATAAASLDDVPTRVVPIEPPALRTRNRRSRRPRRSALARVAAVGGAAALALGLWGVAGALEPASTTVRQLDTRVAETRAGDDARAPQPVVQEQPVQEEPAVQVANAPQTQTTQQGTTQQGTTQKQGPNGAQGRGNGAAAGAGAGDETHGNGNGNGNGNGRSGVGTPGNGRGGD